MSEKKAKQDRKVELMTEEADANEAAKEMAKSISKMYEDRDAKALGAKERLIQQLEVTVDKYRTANGVMSALATVRDVLGGHGDMDINEEIGMAKAVATNMASIAKNMGDKANVLDPEEFDQLCDGFYDKEFSQGMASAADMVEQLMVLNLCQNVGPNAEDIAEFCKTADAEIDKAREDLKAYCAEHGIDFNELCGPHENCPICICGDCANDCKEGRLIKEGQFAIEGCERFVRAEE